MIVAVSVVTAFLQAAATYLAMVASGSLLYLTITAAGVKATTVDCCGSLILCSWMGPAAHLALLWLLPRSVYQRHRAVITLVFRGFYLAATSINGFAVCGVGPIGVPAATNSSVQLESPMSAFLWRSGIIGLIWYAGAFPLLFWQHLLVQSAFLAAYWSTLSPMVCSTISHIQYGPETVAAATSAAQMLWAQLLAAHGAPHAADTVLQAALQQRGAAAGATSAGASHSSCMQGLGLLQVVAGHMLPTFLLYCAESRNRRHWLAAQRQQQHRRQQRTSNASSSSSGQLRGSDSWANLLAASEPAGDTAAASVLEQQQQQQQQAVAGCSSKGAAAAAPDGVDTSAGVRASTAAAATSHAATAAEGSRRAPTRRSSWRGLLSSSGSADEDDAQQLLLDLPPFDAFDEESSGGCLPPNFPEVYVLLLAVGLAWFGLESLLGTSP
jgi:hypothetical protein